MPKKQESITLSIPSEDKDRLEQIALELGFTWAGKPNISGLIKAIARRQFKLYEKEEPPQKLKEVILELIDRINKEL